METHLKATDHEIRWRREVRNKKQQQQHTVIQNTPGHVHLLTQKGFLFFFPSSSAHETSIKWPSLMNLLLWESKDKNCWHQLIVPHLLISSSLSVKPSVRSMSLWTLLSHCSFSSFFNHHYYYYLILLYFLNDLKSKQTFPALACLYPALWVAQANECSRASQWEEGWKGGGWNLRRQIHHREGRRRLAGQPVNTWQHNRGRGRKKKSLSVVQKAKLRQPRVEVRAGEERSEEAQVGLDEDAFSN